MSRHSQRLSVLDSAIRDHVSRRLLHQVAEDEWLDGRLVRVADRTLLQFGSCSYLGLELDSRVQQGAVDAVLRYGSQFSSSRAYLSAPPYRVLQEQLETLFARPLVISATTTLGHLQALPVLIGDEDVALLDHQVHHSVHMACNTVRQQGTKVELLRHDHVESLEEHIVELSRSYQKVWFLADGVYSMFGDLAPLDRLMELVERYPKLHLYIDDAHGTSWTGLHGQGTVLPRIPRHERVVVVASLNKSFAAAGAVIALPDEETRRRVLTLGGPMMFGGPIQPPMLGAALASAEIHLSDELPDLQRDLHQRIQLCSKLLDERELPIPSLANTPIWFMGLGRPEAAQRMAEKLRNEGFFTNLSHFPAVPGRQAGVRFTVTRHLREEDIGGLVEALDRAFPEVVEETGSDPAEIFASFHLDTPARWLRNATVPDPRYRIESFGSIDELEPGEWDPYLGARGSFDHAGLRFLERTFGEPTREEDRWTFRYFRVVDEQGRTCALTFFTGARWKMDMLASAKASELAERRREKEPGWLTATVFGMGSMLSEGDHLYLDRERLDPTSPSGQKALGDLLDAIHREAEALGAEMTVLRDLPAEDLELEGFLRGHGWARTDAPARFEVQPIGANEKAFLGSLRAKDRYFQRKEVVPFDDVYRSEVISSGPIDEALSRHLYGLYRDVHGRSYELNTFPLPEDVFDRMLEFPGWELLLLHRADEDALPVGVGACYVTEDAYLPMVIGLDYRFVREQGLYRQSLRHALIRARALGKSRVSFGMGASLQKKRFGGRRVHAAVYTQARDHYLLDVVESLEGGG